MYLGKVERRFPSPILSTLPGPGPCVVDTDPCKDEDLRQALYSVVQCAGILMFMMLCEDVATTPSLYSRVFSFLCTKSSDSAVPSTCSIATTCEGIFLLFCQLQTSNPCTRVQAWLCLRWPARKFVVPPKPPWGTLKVSFAKDACAPPLGVCNKIRTGSGSAFRHDLSDWPHSLGPPMKKCGCSAACLTSV